MNIRQAMKIITVCGGKETEITLNTNPAVFNAHKSKPLISLLANITFTQEGSGTPSLSNVRPITMISELAMANSSKNIFDVSTYPLTQNKYIDGRDGTHGNAENYAATSSYIPVMAYVGATVTLNKRPGGANAGVAFYSKESPEYFVSGVKNNGGTAGEPITFTIPLNAKYMRFTVPSNTTDIQIEVGTFSSTFESYNGTNKIITFPALGRNLFDGSTGVQLQVNNLRVARNKGYGVPFLMKAGETYSVSTNGATNPTEFSVQIPYTGTNYAVEYGSGKCTYSPNEDTEIGVNAYWNNGRPENATDLQIEHGNKKTKYYPFNNYMCGGSYDFVSGVLTVTHFVFKCRILDYTHKELSDGFMYYRYDFMTSRAIKNNSSQKCNIAPYTWGGVGAGYDHFYGYNSSDPNYAACLLLYLSGEIDETQELQFVAELQEPYTVQLDQNEIKTLVGSNNIYVGNCSALTTTYVDIV